MRFFANLLQYAIGTNQVVTPQGRPGYGVELLAFRMDTLTWSPVTYFGHLATGKPSDNFGALWGTPNGYIFGSESNTGLLYQLPIVGYPGVNQTNATIAPVQGPVPGGAYDGARCYYANLDGTINSTAAGSYPT